MPITSSRPRRRPVTLTEVAQSVGVSVSTASNAYNRPDQLSEKLRRRILDTADNLGYQGPDPAARAMARRRYDAIGLVVSERFSYAFHSMAGIEVLRGVATACDQAGVALTLLPLRSDTAECPLIGRAAIDAIGLYALMDDAPAIGQALKRGLPLVTVDQPKVAGVPFIGIDDEAAARRAAEYLISLGHQRLGVLSLPVTPGQSGTVLNNLNSEDVRYRVTRERLRGYISATRSHNLPDPVVFVAGLSSAAAGQAAASAILSAGASRPTALLCMSDELAIGAEIAAESLGIRVPDQLSVIGFDNFPGTSPARVPLTTISQNAYERGLLLGTWLTHPEAQSEARILGTDLIIRESTGVPPS